MQKSFNPVHFEVALKVLENEVMSATAVDVESVLGTSILPTFGSLECF